jgi:hypothetical protein
MDGLWGKIRGETCSPEPKRGTGTASDWDAEEYVSAAVMRPENRRVRKLVEVGCEGVSASKRLSGKSGDRRGGQPPLGGNSTKRRLAARFAPLYRPFAQLSCSKQSG